MAEDDTAGAPVGDRGTPAATTRIEAKAAPFAAAAAAAAEALDGSDAVASGFSLQYVPFRVQYNPPGLGFFFFVGILLPHCLPVATTIPWHRREVLFGVFFRAAGGACVFFIPFFFFFFFFFGVFIFAFSFFASMALSLLYS